MANQTLQAKLRGLSPNNTLSWSMASAATALPTSFRAGRPYQGGAGPDLNFIPIDAVDHVEVLLEGAGRSIRLRCDRRRHQYHLEEGQFRRRAQSASRGGYMDAAATRTTAVPT